MAKAKSLKEWIDIYESKTNDKFGIPQGYRLFYMAERGFATMKLDNKGGLVLVYQVCGDAKFWRDMGELMGIQNGCEAISTICTRHILPYIRGFGWEVLTEYVKDGKRRYLCQDSGGRRVVITHKHFDKETNEPTYWVTHYFNEKAITELEEGETNGQKEFRK